jgi:hypothetical protein
VTGSRNQACDKGAEHGSPTPARVVHELEEAEIERQLVLWSAPSEWSILKYGSYEPKEDCDVEEETQA